MQAVLETKTIKEKLGCGRSLYLTIATEPGSGKISKLLITVGKSGQCHRAMFEALQNVINVLLKYNGGRYEEVIDALKGIRCESPKLGVATSCADYIAKVLRGDVKI